MMRLCVIFALISSTAIGLTFDSFRPEQNLDLPKLNARYFSNTERGACRDSFVSGLTHGSCTTELAEAYVDAMVDDVCSSTACSQNLGSAVKAAFADGSNCTSVFACNSDDDCGDSFACYNEQYCGVSCVDSPGYCSGGVEICDGRLCELEFPYTERDPVQYEHFFSAICTASSDSAEHNCLEPETLRTIVDALATNDSVQICQAAEALGCCLGTITTCAPEVFRDYDLCKVVAYCPLLDYESTCSDVDCAADDFGDSGVKYCDFDAPAACALKLYELVPDSCEDSDFTTLLDNFRNPGRAFDKTGSFTDDVCNNACYDAFVAALLEIQSLAETAPFSGCMETFMLNEDPEAEEPNFRSFEQFIGFSKAVCAANANDDFCIDLINEIDGYPNCTQIASLGCCAGTLASCTGSVYRPYGLACAGFDLAQQTCEEEIDLSVCDGLEICSSGCDAFSPFADCFKDFLTGSSCPIDSTQAVIESMITGNPSLSCGLDCFSSFKPGFEAMSTSETCLSIFNDECEENGDCESGDDCVEGRCRTACFTDDDCENGRCTASHCIPSDDGYTFRAFNNFIQIVCAVNETNHVCLEENAMIFSKSAESKALSSEGNIFKTMKVVDTVVASVNSRLPAHLKAEELKDFNKENCEALRTDFGGCCYGTQVTCAQTNRFDICVYQAACDFEPCDGVDCFSDLCTSDSGKCITDFAQAYYTEGVSSAYLERAIALAFGHSEYTEEVCSHAPGLSAVYAAFGAISSKSVCNKLFGSVGCAEDHSTGGYSCYFEHQSCNEVSHECQYACTANSDCVTGSCVNNFCTTEPTSSAVLNRIKKACTDASVTASKTPTRSTTPSPSKSPVYGVKVKGSLTLTLDCTAFTDLKSPALINAFKNVIVSRSGNALSKSQIDLTVQCAGDVKKVADDNKLIVSYVATTTSTATATTLAQNLAVTGTNGATNTQALITSLKTELAAPEVVQVLTPEAQATFSASLNSLTAADVVVSAPTVEQVNAPTSPASLASVSGFLLSMIALLALW